MFLLYHFLQGRATSPRKGTRFDNNRQPLPSSGLKGVNRFVPKSKKPVDLDDAIGALQNEPSGWGDLPSPKHSEADTGTEVWGIPDDVKEKMGRPNAVPHGKSELGTIISLSLSPFPPLIHQWLHSLLITHRLE